ncbi:hypothetical protein [Candidatus Nitrotoga sp. M5]|uniref:hypothetical protein n=1 Tax=Candidatus Nitrotoga sp. M5 TaxID=2890409 RepID=UPI001EF2F94B|nr:hypothetical protein [Candidatus Nitrotoga sp. M5]CAH1386805.1 conserved exported hypothetical protein [Candidatus Nitrotoga sp. M5]
MKHSNILSAVWNAAIAAIIVSGAAAPFASAADDVTKPTFALRGFGTLGLVHSSEKNADFTSGFFEPNGAGYTRNWAPGVDTKLGVQADAQFSDKFSAVFQLVSQHQYNNTYKPRVEWANLKYQFTPDFDIRLGRTVATPFMVSDTRLVGYANLWIRPPREVYGLVPITNKDGIDVNYRFGVGEATNSVHFSYGAANPKLPDSGTVKAKNYVTLANTLNYGPIALRASYSWGRIDLHTPETDALLDGLTQFGNTVSAIPGFATEGKQALNLANKYRFHNEPLSFISFGASYDRDEWLLMAEWAVLNGASFLASSTAWHATAGYRIGKFTPYMTVAQLRPDKQSETGISTAALAAIPSLAATAAAFNSGINRTLTAGAFGQKSLVAGVRWDFIKNTALKVQYDYMILDSMSSGRLSNIQPNFQPGGKVNAISIALDFIF